MNFPVDTILPSVADALAANRIVLLEAPPGSGKTTRVAPFVLDSAPPWLGRKKILMLEPRRLAARMAASYMAQQRNETVGEMIGYQVRLERHVTRQTRIEILTEGLLTQRLLHDPEIADVGLVIFDEFHERSLAADTGLALTLDLRSALRPDLRIVIMSATLDSESIAARLEHPQMITASGKLFPVETCYAPSFNSASEKYCNVSQVANAVSRAAVKEEGNILTFLPGEGEIRRVAELLRDLPLPANVRVYPLYASLPKPQQDAAVSPTRPGERKIVLATSIAESSLTIEGIRVVIDSGWARLPRFSPSTGMSRLVTVRITRDRADQRRGRAGRLCPGVCYRLWSEAVDQSLAEQALPEMLDADLASLVLQCAEWGATERTALPWITPPPDAAWRRALSLLRELDAVSPQGCITERGREMVKFPIHPRLSHLILQAAQSGCARRACLLAAIVSEAPSESSVRRETDFRRIADLAVRAHTGFAYRVNELSERWGARFPKDSNRDALSDGLLLAWAFPDRLAKRRDKSGRYLLRSGRGAVLEESDPLCSSEWLVCVELQDAPSDAKIRCACPLDAEEIREWFGDETENATVTAWDKRTESVVSVQQTRLGAIVLREGGQAHPDAGKILDALFEGIRQKGIAQLPWTKTSSVLRNRIQFLHLALPEQGWPDVSDEALAERLADWLGPFCDGIQRWARVQELNLTEILQCYLTSLNCSRRELDRLAPSHWTVPSGSSIPIRYDQEKPYLAVRIQEVFGMTATPRIADGRIPVVMHLLSPAQRPVQVTSDLESFWNEGYALVRKDLRGRYPKHYWPEDPRQAEATRRVRPH